MVQSNEVGVRLINIGITTTLVHSAMKQILTSHPPQGRHALDLVRFATSFALPTFLFSSRFIPNEIHVEGGDVIQDAVHHVLDVKGKLSFFERQNARVLKGEWVLPPGYDPLTPPKQIVLYLHGG
jgi:hypothetical protein